MKGVVFEEAALVMAEGDTVATAIDDLDAGRTIRTNDGDVTLADTVALAEDVAFGHKFALVDHAPGDEVRKYGEVIGRATDSVSAGEWVHTHNVESTRGRGDLAAEEADAGEDATGEGSA